MSRIYLFNPHTLVQKELSSTFYFLKSLSVEYLLELEKRNAKQIETQLQFWEKQLVVFALSNPNDHIMTNRDSISYWLNQMKAFNYDLLWYHMNDPWNINCVNEILITLCRFDGNFFQPPNIAWARDYLVKIQINHCVLEERP